jgi:cytochrome c5
VSEQDDRIFLQRFSLIIAALAVAAVLIIFVASAMNARLAGSDAPSRETAKVDRIQPMFGVYTGDSAPAAQTAAAEDGDTAGEQAAAEQQVAFGGSTDGEMIYNNACQACHMAGAAGAPQLVAEQWGERLDKGMDTLVDHAINGFNAMPARGGRTDLSDEQVRASVEYMLSQVQQ